MLSDATQRYIDENLLNKGANWHRLFAFRIMLSVWPRIFRVVAKDMPATQIHRIQLVSCRLALSAAVRANTHIDQNKNHVFEVHPLETLDSVYRTCYLSNYMWGDPNTEKLLNNLLEWASISFSKEAFSSLLNTEKEWIEVVETTEFNLFHRRPTTSSLVHEGWEILCNEGPEWSFWRDWYQGFLNRKPLDWELQRRVALIPDADWEKGPEHIAKLIEEIRARFELEKRIEALEAEKQVWEQRARLGIGGNNPPENLEDEKVIQEIIWAPIEDLKSETQSDTPDKSRIRDATSKLGAVLIAIGKWPLGKLDQATDEFAKSIGKWGGGVCAAWLAEQSGLIAKIIEAAQSWLGVLP